jgi:hypothetical protein
MQEWFFEYLHYELLTIAGWITYWFKPVRENFPRIFFNNWNGGAQQWEWTLKWFGGSSSVLIITFLYHRSEGQYRNNYRNRVVQRVLAQAYLEIQFCYLQQNRWGCYCVNWCCNPSRSSWWTQILLVQYFNWSKCCTAINVTAAVSASIYDNTINTCLQLERRYGHCNQYLAAAVANITTNTIYTLSASGTSTPIITEYRYHQLVIWY